MGGGRVILYTLGSLDIGGAELRSLELFEALDGEDDLRPIVYVTSRGPGILDPAFRSLGITVIYGYSGPLGLLHLWWTCVSRRPSIIHCNSDILNGFYCFAARLAGVPVRIAHFRTTALPRDNLYQHALLAAGRFLLRISGARAVGVCAAARQLAGVPGGNWQTIYEGVKWPAIRPGGGGGGKRLLFLGRIHPEKNYIKAVDIFDLLLEREGADAALLDVVGTGTDEDLAQLRQRVARSPYRNSIAVHGLSRDPARHLAAATVLLLPSEREGLPGSVLEALSRGVPVVASDLPGLQEIQQSSKGVRLVDARAGADAWAEALRSALNEGPSAEIGECFRTGPFLFDRYLDRIRALWSLPRKEVVLHE